MRIHDRVTDLEVDVLRLGELEVLQDVFAVNGVGNELTS
jgi:hypothetical protein